MTVSALREERSDLAKSAAALKRADAGGAHTNGGFQDGAGDAASLADSLVIGPNLEEGIAEAALGQIDDPEVLRAIVAQMKANLKDIISYPGAEVELERLQRQVCCRSHLVCSLTQRMVGDWVQTCACAYVGGKCELTNNHGPKCSLSSRIMHLES